MSIGSIAAKTAGAVGLGLIAYDSHCKGKITADSSVRNILQSPERLQKQGINCPRVITLVQQIEKEKLIPSSISDKDKICITPKETAKLIRKII